MLIVFADVLAQTLHISLALESHQAAEVQPESNLNKRDFRKQLLRAVLVERIHELSTPATTTTTTRADAIAKGGKESEFLLNVLQQDCINQLEILCHSGASLSVCVSLCVCLCTCV